MKNIALALAATLLLSACDTPTEIGPAAANDYVLPPKIVLDVQSISFINLVSPERPASLYDDTDFQPTIAGAIRKWATDRLEAGGRSGEAIVTVKEASLMKEAIPSDQSIDKIFTREQASKYLGHATVTIEVRKDDSYAAATGQASRWVSLPEDPTLEEQKKSYFSMLNMLMRDLGQNLEDSMHEHMGGLIMTKTSGAIDPLTLTAAPASALSSAPAGK